MSFKILSLTNPKLLKGSVDLIIVLFSAESSGENPEKVYPAERERSSGAERGCGVS